MAGIDLTAAELACLQTAAAGTITIGDPTQTGNITFNTATVATAAAASTVSCFRRPGGSGQILLDNQRRGRPPNGDGETVSLTAGTGSIVPAFGNPFSEIATTGNVTLNTAGPIGFLYGRIQFDATAAPASIVIGSAAQAVEHLPGRGSAI